jgi:hypothetical protein
MKVYKMHLEGDENEVKVEELSEKEFLQRMRVPFALLLKRRILARKSKNYDKNLLSKEIGIVD